MFRITLFVAFMILATSLAAQNPDAVVASAEVIAITDTAAQVRLSDPLGRSFRAQVIEVSGPDFLLTGPWMTGVRTVSVSGLWPASRYQLTVVSRNASGEIQPEARVVQWATTIFRRDARIAPQARSLMQWDFARALAAATAGSPEVQAEIRRVGREVLDARLAERQAELDAQAAEQEGF